LKRKRYRKKISGIPHRVVLPRILPRNIYRLVPREIRGIRIRKRIMGVPTEFGTTKKGIPYARARKKVTPTTTLAFDADTRKGVTVAVKQKIRRHTLTVERELLTKTNRIHLSKSRKPRRKRRKR